AVHAGCVVVHVLAGERRLGAALARDAVRLRRQSVAPVRHLASISVNASNTRSSSPNSDRSPFAAFSTTSKRARPAWSGVHQNAQREPVARAWPRYSTPSCAVTA